jgi:hypothetical protein
MNKIKILIVGIVGLLMSLGTYARATVIETDAFIFSNEVTLAISSFDSTNALVMTGQTSTNFTINVQKSNIGLSDGRMYVSGTNIFSSTARLNWFKNNDFTCSNLFWRNSSVAFYNSYLTNVTAIGTSILYVADSSGFTTNNLIWLGFSNHMYRVSAVTGNTLYLSCPLVKYEPTNNPVAKVVEFGGFKMIDRANSNNIYGRLEFTNAINNITINGRYNYGF